MTNVSPGGRAGGGTNWDSRQPSSTALVFGRKGDGNLVAAYWIDEIPGAPAWSVFEKRGSCGGKNMTKKNCTRPSAYYIEGGLTAILV